MKILEIPPELVYDSKKVKHIQEVIYETLNESVGFIRRGIG
mgnify:CR=1 FL=1